MLVVWQYRHATSPASQDIQSPAALHALLRVLDQRAAADGYPHAVLLSASTRLSRLGVGVHNDGQGPQPELTLVVGADDAPVLWWDSLPAIRRIRLCRPSSGVSSAPTTRVSSGCGPCPSL